MASSVISNNENEGVKIVSAAAEEGVKIDTAHCRVTMVVIVINVCEYRVTCEEKAINEEETPLFNLLPQLCHYLI